MSTRTKQVPRPLHLVQDSNSTDDGAETSSRPERRWSDLATPSPRLAQTRHPKRQSSISYRSSHSPRTAVFTPTLSSVPLASSSPLSLTPQHDTRVRSPLTLAEKHADLLQFIAQKEAKCLELRTQLEIHEAELLQYKRKWERIVARGAPSSPKPSSPPPVDGSRTTSSKDKDFKLLASEPSQRMASDVMLDGLREGVRMLADAFVGPPDTVEPTSQRPDSVPSRTASGISLSEDFRIERDAVVEPAQCAEAPSKRQSHSSFASISAAAPWMGKKLDELASYTNAPDRKRASLQYLSGLMGVISPPATPRASSDQPEQQNSSSLSSVLGRPGSEPSTHKPRSQGAKSLSAGGKIGTPADNKSPAVSQEFVPTHAASKSASTTSVPSLSLSSTSTTSLTCSLLDEDDAWGIGGNVLTPDNVQVRESTESEDEGEFGDYQDAMGKDRGIDQQVHVPPSIAEEDEWNW
ncbi:hypothetical protein FISHEDRAFT_75917 [Fistulina hepatica ATCC 64428]|uniref:Uncharacterized protein n=1 Tax=Fistulina hepatica ATCC 64428 TaxID=1128425 RepID=A0A0D7A5S0_9AGAR|nr:hypothetical protein FISHEDRAFT_75917 [Fistulina hepatica ATCC 64428]